MKALFLLLFLITFGNLFAQKIEKKYDTIKQDTVLLNKIQKLQETKQKNLFEAEYYKILKEKEIDTIKYLLEKEQTQYYFSLFISALLIIILLLIVFILYHRSKTRLRKMNNELENNVIQRTHQMQIALQKAEESDNLKTSFLSNISHEIRTPLNAIIGMSNILRNDELSEEESSDFLEIIEDNGKSLLALIENILDLAKIEAGKIKVVKTKFNLWEMFDSLIKSFEISLQKNNKQDVIIYLDSDVKTVNKLIYSDKEKIRQILLNLLDNSLKFTNKGYIKLGCTFKNDPGKIIEFFVIDTGGGIREEKMDFIFDRFRKGDEELTKYYRGVGLGLAISKNLVTLMGGEIRFESEIGKGTKFYFTVPL